jgi:ribonucleoside-diphosphate reductase alpha chain
VKKLAEPEFESEEIISERLVELDKDNLDSYQTVRSNDEKFTRTNTSHQATIHQKVKNAIDQGYTGDICPECQSMSMVRNGTCLKCLTCGSTTGCS